MAMTGVVLLYANVYINIKILSYIMSIILDLFNEFGGYGPLILGLFSIYLLWDKHNLFFYYCVGVFINSILNLVLKGIIQSPRPLEDVKQFNLALSRGNRFIFKNGIPHDMFGMPSGHSQSVMFSTIFIYFSLRKLNILYLYLFISLLTMTHRVMFNHHSVLQVIVGALTGSVFGYIAYVFAREKMKGRIMEKVDDYGPI
jgi:membrane-associated phospholipid phosphatase